MYFTSILCFSLTKGLHSKIYTLLCVLHISICIWTRPINAANYVYFIIWIKNKDVYCIYLNIRHLTPACPDPLLLFQFNVESYNLEIVFYLKDSIKHVCTTWLKKQAECLYFLTHWAHKEKICFHFMQSRVKLTKISALAISKGFKLNYFKRSFDY